MVYQLKRLQTNKRPQAFWGSLIPSAISFIGGLITSSQQAKAQRRALEEQQRLAQQQLNISNQNQLASSLNNYASAQQSYDDKDYNLKYRIGGVKRLGSRNIMITDGGNAKRIGNNTYLLRGGSHEDINETGQTGIGINVGGNEIEAEGGEVAQRKGNSLRIYSAQPILGGMSPAQAILRGYNKDKVFNAQQRFKKNNGIKDDGSKAQVGGYYGANYPSPLSLLSILYDKTLGRFDDKNPNLQTGIAPTPSRSLNLKQVRGGLVNKSMLPTNRVYRITDMREVKDAKAIGQYRKLPENITLPTKTVRTKSGRTFEFGKAAGNSHGGKAAAMGEPWTGTTSGGYNESKYIISTPTRHTTWSVGHAGNYSKPLPADAIKKGSGLWKKFDAEGNTGISTKRMVVYKDLGNGRYLRLPKSKYRLGGLTSKDRGSFKHPYPSVSSKDFAGGGRSYPIPTKADAVDALRLAGLHGRSDVRSKLYSKYPSLRPKAAFGDWVRTNRNDNILANLLYESGIIDKNAWRNMLRDIHTFTGMGSDPYNDNQDEAVVTPGFGITNQAQILRNIQQANKIAQSARASQAVQRSSYAAKQAKDFYRDLGINIPVGRSQTYNPAFRSSELARAIEDYNNSLRISLNNTHLPKGIRLTPTDQSSIGRTAAKVINPREAELVKQGINIPQSARNMTSGLNPFLYAPRSSNNVSESLSRIIASAKQGVKSTGQKIGNKLTSSSTYRNSTFAERIRDANGKLIWKQNYKYKPWVKATAGAAGTAGVIGLGIGLSNTNSKNENNKTQLDAKGQPISPYIARPQEPAKSQTKVVKPTRQVPATIAHKDTTRTDTTRTDTTKQVNKVVKRQVRTTPKYTGNTTKGNYQLHDGETKVINGVKYTRRGNTIINHKTNVGYIYDKNGNYTGQADYSKVGNFNQAFDAARAAGRNQFIYRAGKYNNYSTVKETNAKKEALNRIIGARRVAKRMGCITNPPVERFKCGGSTRPKAEDGMLAPVYSYGINRRRLPSFATIDVTPRAIPNFKPVSVPTNVETPFDPNSVPYLGKQSSFKPTTQDYIGLGVDTLAALGSGMFTRSAYNKMNFDYALPNYVDESPVAFDTTYHNEAQRANVERNRLNTRGLITGNTSSAQTALNLMQKTDTDAMMETNKLLDEKSNKEVELRNQNLANEQQVRARNAAARNQYYQNVAQIKNAVLESKNNMELSKAQSIGTDLSGLSQAYSNFASSVENRYDARQNEIAAISSANSPSVVKNAISLGYNLSPEVLANLYKNSKNEELRNAILGRLSPNERKRYGIE